MYCIKIWTQGTYRQNQLEMVSFLPMMYAMPSLYPPHKLVPPIVIHHIFLLAKLKTSLLHVFLEISQYRKYCHHLQNRPHLLYHAV